MSIEVKGAGGSANLTTKTISPSTSSLTVYASSSGYDGFSSVTVNAISPTKSAQTYTPTTYNQTISSGQWLSGAQTIKGDSNLISSNIKNGVSIFGVSGSLAGYKQFQFTNVAATSTGLTVSVGETLTLSSIVGILLSSEELVNSWDTSGIIFRFVTGIYKNGTRHSDNGVNWCGKIKGSNSSVSVTALTNYFSRYYYSVSGTSITLNCDELASGYKYERTLYYS